MVMEMGTGQIAARCLQASGCRRTVQHDASRRHLHACKLAANTRLFGTSLRRPRRRSTRRTCGVWHSTTRWGLRAGGKVARNATTTTRWPCPLWCALPAAALLTVVSCLPPPLQAQLAAAEQEIQRAKEVQVGLVLFGHCFLRAGREVRGALWLCCSSSGERLLRACCSRAAAIAERPEKH